MSSQDIKKIIKKVLKEATSDSSGGRGSYVGPLVPGFKDFDKSALTPFTEPASKYNNALLAYDSYDGNIEIPKKIRKKLESKSEKLTKYLKNNPNLTMSDEDGNNVNATPGKSLKFVPVNEWIEITDDLIKESNTTVTAGLYNGPIEIGLKKWKRQLAPFTDEVNHEHNYKIKNTKLKNNINKTVGVWEKNKDGSYHVPTHDADGIKEKPINEDLAVWFGTKKKPKGSSQPKGPWVNICRKVNGKHPPCGRPEASDKSYPKCRASGVAGKMSDSQKKAACAQKRKAEKTHSKSGTGNKPKMVSYKPKKKIKESELVNIIKKLIS